MLRSKMADADAAIKGFESNLRIFPLNQKDRLQTAKRGIHYLDIALNDAKGIGGWEDMTRYLEVTKFTPRSCLGADLAFNREKIKEAFAFSGSYFVRDAAGEVRDEDRNVWQKGIFPTLRLSEETAGCQQQYTAATRKAEEEKKAAAVAHQAKWKYHIDVYNPESCSMSAYADGKKVADVIRRSTRFHLDANVEAHLSDVFCVSLTPNSIRVKINGYEYDLHWVRSGNIYHTAQLAPTDQ